MANLPGVGARWLQNIARGAHMAVWAVDLRAEAEGTVRERFARTDVRFDLTPRDVSNLRAAVRFTAEMHHRG